MADLPHLPQVIRVFSIIGGHGKKSAGASRHRAGGGQRVFGPSAHQAIQKNKCVLP